MSVACVEGVEKETERAHEARVEFRLLGPLEVRANNLPLPVGGPRQRAVLSALLLHVDQVVSVEYLIDQVWNGKPPATARTQIAICIATFRKMLRNAGSGVDTVVTTGPGYMFRGGRHLIDTIEFARRLREAEDLERGEAMAQAAGVYSDALALWRGPALDDIPTHFAEIEAMRLEEQRLLAAERHAELRLLLGQHREVLGDLLAMLNANPLRDQLRRNLMLAQYLLGRRAEALKTFREGNELSIKELGLELGEDLQQLHKAILSDDVTFTTDRRSAAGPTTPQPPRQPSQPPVPTADLPLAPAQLPSTIPGFTGRSDALRAMDRALLSGSKNDAAHVGFVVGSPGIGKTALAIDWSHRVAAHFPDGQLFVNLNEDGDQLRPADVLPRFLSALHVPPEQMPHSVRELAALYRSILNDRRVLVVLDDATNISQVEPMVPGNGLSCVLVTVHAGCSNLSGSHSALRLRLGPLESTESVALLRSVVGADRVDAHPDAARRVAELCCHMPLALHAVGARLVNNPHLPLHELARRLDSALHRLSELDYGMYSVRASLDLAVKELDSVVVLAYHRLAALGRGVFGTAAAARHLGVDMLTAESFLERLTDAHMLEVVGWDENGMRCRWNELCRLHAEEGASTNLDALPQVRAAWGFSSLPTAL